MAIHPDLPGIEVTVCVDGSSLTEYDTENDEIKHDNKTAALHQDAWTVTKYAECVSQSTFKIKLNVRKPYKLDCNALSFEVEVNGSRIVTTLMFEEDYAGKEWLCNVEGPETTYAHGTLRQAMKFAKLNITEETLPKSVVDQHISKMSPVGSITITVRREKMGRKFKTASSSSFQEKDHSSKIHHKSVVKDTKSHGIALGSAKSIKPANYYSSTSLGGVDFPLAKFVFKYRDFKALQSLNVVPKSPSLSPEPTMASDEPVPVFDLENMTSQQKSELSKLLQRIGGIGNVAKGTTIKRERKSEEADPPKKKLKTASKKENVEGENSDRVRMKTITTVKKIPFMDLTEDSDEE